MPQVEKASSSPGPHLEMRTTNKGPRSHSN